MSTVVRPTGDAEPPPASGEWPSLSVVLPLIDDRGLGESALLSWLGQTLAGRRFEIVAVAGSERSRLVR